MTPFIAHLLPAVALGLCVAIPFGPIGLMCVERTLAFGIWFGIASGMGAATAHGIFSCLAAVNAAVLAQKRSLCTRRCASLEGSSWS